MAVSVSLIKFSVLAAGVTRSLLTVSLKVLFRWCTWEVRTSGKLQHVSTTSQKSMQTFRKFFILLVDFLGLLGIFLFVSSLGGSGIFST